MNSVELSAQALITLGSLLLVGLGTDALGRRTAFPRVTLMMLFGILIGPSGFDLLPQFVPKLFPLVADMALLMIGFLLGERLVSAFRGRNGRQVLIISGAEALLTSTIVALGLWLLGVTLELALILGAIASATAPAATVDVVDNLDAKGPFSDTLLGVVALDDAWGLVVFSLMLAAAQVLSGSGSAGSSLTTGVWDIGGALLLGLLLGGPMALLSGRVRPGKPILIEALGMVFLCGGLAIWLEVSFLLAAMSMGGTVALLARHHERPFHAIENADWPFLILFFILAGASLDLASLGAISVLGGAYVLLRVAGRLLGGWVGGGLAGTGPGVRRWIGLALMPQAGVALGMALVASQKLPEIGEVLLPVVIGATVIFELGGPLATRWALRGAGEAGRRDSRE